MSGADGNVRDVCPEGSPRRAGSLVFNADYESGNLGGVARVREFEYELTIRPDLNNSRHRIWFSFTVTNALAGQHALFTVTNFSKTRSLYRDGMGPVMRSRSRPTWERVPPHNVFYYKAAPTRKAYVMSFAVVFDQADDAYEFAYCFPYTFTRLQDHLRGADAAQHGHLQHHHLGRSLEGRPLDILSISAPRNFSDATRAPDLKVVFVSARVHPGETPASFVMQGLIDFLLGSCQAARRLREKTLFKIVPMLNPDGVYHGTYRCSVNGHDLNRCWRNPTEWTHPTIAALKAHLADMQKSHDVDFFLDIHGHTVLTNCFMYGNEFEDARRQEAQWVFPRILGEATDTFSLEQTQFNNDKQKAGTGRRSLGGLLSPEAYCYTLEVSCYGYCRGDDPEVVPWTEGSLLALGAHVGTAFGEFYSRVLHG